MSHAIIVERVSKSFGKKKVLEDVSLQVPKGVVFALLGENSAQIDANSRLARLSIASIPVAFACVASIRSVNRSTSAVPWGTFPMHQVYTNG